MALNLSELRQWPPEIADLAASTSQAASHHTSSAEFYRSLNAVSGWEGAASEAAKAAMEASARDHDAVAENLEKAAAAMKHVGQEAESVATTIGGILDDAAATPDVQIDETTNAVATPNTEFMTEEYVAQVAAKVTDLELRIADVLEDGARLDADLAGAITTAAGLPQPGHGGIQLVDFHGGPLPQKPSWASPEPPPGGWSDDPITRAAQKIAYGHAGTDHLVNDWPPGTTREQMASQIEGIMRAGADPKGGMITGRTADGAPAIYDPKTNTIVIRDPGAPDAGTAFKPSAGEDYLTRKMPTRLPSIPPGELADVPKPPPVERPKIEPLPRGGGTPPMAGVPPMVGIPGSGGYGEVPILDSDGTPDVGMPGPGR